MRVNLIKCGTGSPIVFVHGIASSATSWAPVMTRLQDRYCVTSFDLIGHGSSPAPQDAAEYTRDRALQDIDDILADLDEPPLLVGHSLGGYLVLAYGATRPGTTRGLVVLNTGPGFRNPEKRQIWNDRAKLNAPRLGLTPQAAELNLQTDSVVMDHLADFTEPTLVLAGSEDHPNFTESGKYLERKMPNCRFVAVEGGKHNMHEESHTDEIAGLIAEFY